MKGTRIEASGRPGMTADEVRAAVGRIKWWHQIDLGNGIVTPGLDRSLLETLQQGRMVLHAWK